jgi:site-specific recombinase XerD
MTAQTGLQVIEKGNLVAIEGTNPALVYLASLAPTGRRTMRGTLAKVAEMLGTTLEAAPWASMEYEHIQAIRTKLAETLKPATVNKYLAAIRGTMRAAWRMGLIDAEHYQRVADVQGVTGSTLPAGRSLGSGELGAMLRVCQEDQSPAGLRDGALLAIAYAGGLRRAELASLDLASILEDDGETVTIRVLGKRSKERLCYLDNGAAMALRDWLNVRGPEAGPLFFSGRRGGHLVKGQRMTGQAIRDVIHRRAAQAGVEDCSPHDLRRSFVSDLLDAGVDIATVAGMAGHANIETTRRYDRRGETAKKRAARSLHIPYAKRRLQG